MIIVPEDIRFTESHVWIMMEDEFIGICGITDFIQGRMTEIVFVELPEVNMEVRAGEAIALIESYSDVMDIMSAVSGRIIAVNNNLLDIPSLINRSPLDEGWIIKIDVKDPTELIDLMDNDTYNDYVLAL